MLTVAKITQGAAGGYAEYLDGKTRAAELGDYYLKDRERVEAPGRWAQGAKRFDLDPEQRVTGEQLRTLMEVRRPDSGEELRRVGGSGEAVAAIDATFSAPKSVSVVWAVSDRKLRERIEQAHETAIDRALNYATRQVPMLRRRVDKTKVVHEKARGLVATSWRHTTARAVDQQVPDPQLHSHVLLHAAVRRDGRMVAIDSRSWLVHQREVGAAYRTELARELATLGFDVIRNSGRGGRYFEIDGIPQGLLDRWSSRRHQVQAAIKDRLDHQEQELTDRIAQGGSEATEAAVQLEQLKQHGQLSPKQERLMAELSRNAKTPVTVKELDTDWQRTALGHRVSRERIDVLRHAARPALEPAAAHDVLEGLTEFDATFAAREARAVALERSAGTPINTALKQLQALRASGEILLLADGTGTTKDHRGQERAVVAITQRLAATRIQPIEAALAGRETQRLDRELAKVGGRLSDGQRAAIQLACGEHPLVLIEGHAGTGKSTTLTGIARAHQACGRQIIVTSTAALAAERLATELAQHGVQCAPYSTAGLQAAINSGRVQLGPDTTVIHDEAVLASTREQLQLMRAVETSGARLIAVGDPQQNQPVGAGGLWDQIEHATRDAEALVELTHNQRARDPADRQSQTLFREGEIEPAIRTYATRERIHFDADQRHVEDQALEAAHSDRAAGKATIAIAQTSNEHLDELNARAQAIRLQKGELGKDARAIPGRPYELYAGDLVQIRHTISHPDHGQLRNGTNATVTEVHSGELALKLTEGTELVLEEPQIEQADLRLAYVQHPFPAQGHTTDTAHVIIAGHATREGTYVALTRAREQTHIYHAPSDSSPDGDRLQLLAQRVSRTEPEVPSISTPLAHEAAVAASAELEANAQQITPTAREEITHERVDGRRRLAEHYLERSGNGVPAIDPGSPDNDEVPELTDERSDLSLEPSGERHPASPPTEHELEDTPQRTWPGREARDHRGPEWDADRLTREETNVWEP